jgi:hypothetical protein
LNPICPVCADLLKQAGESVCAHLRAIAELELAVRENRTDRIPSAETELAALRELSDDAVWRYRAHSSFMHMPSPQAEAADTSHSV